MITLWFVSVIILSFILFLITENVILLNLFGIQVALHASEDDAWTVFRGRVFNITPYLHYHPGKRRSKVLWWIFFKNITSPIMFSFWMILLTVDTVHLLIMFNYILLSSSFALCIILVPHCVLYRRCRDSYAGSWKGLYGAIQLISSMGECWRNGEMQLIKFKYYATS